MMNAEKLHFLKEEVLPLLRRLDENTPAQWGRMNVRQMLEHMSEYVRLAGGKMSLPRLNEGEALEKSYQFLLSEKPFRPNTKNPYIGEDPTPLRRASKEESLAELEQELLDFHRHYEQQEGQRNPNPFFGDLNYEEQVQLLHKHFQHHLRQFGIEAP